MSHKQYLGDGVYVDIENGMFKLTTEDGRTVSNTIYMEPEVFRAYCLYVDQAIGEAARQRSQGDK